MALQANTKSVKVSWVDNVSNEKVLETGNTYRSAKCCSLVMSAERNPWSAWSLQGSLMERALMVGRDKAMLLV